MSFIDNLLSALNIVQKPASKEEEKKGNKSKRSRGDEEEFDYGDEDFQRFLMEQQ